MLKSKLVLGVVQLGMDYGLNNVSGQPSREEAFLILDTALAEGIDTFDAAWAYGTAEDILGEWIQTRAVAHKVKVISKMKPHALNDYTKDVKPQDAVRAEVKKSLKRLGVKSLDGYLLHTPQYLHNDAVIAGLREIKAAGLVHNIGVSIYNEDEALSAVEVGVDYIQAPYNAFDRRLDKTDFFDLAKNKGIIVFARSPFLQGLFLMDPERIPPHLARARPHVKQFADIARRHNTSRLEAALLFACNSRADSVVFGVETLSQLKEILSITARFHSAGTDCVKEISDTFQNIDTTIVNPSLWSETKK